MLEQDNYDKIIQHLDTKKSAFQKKNEWQWSKCNTQINAKNWLSTIVHDNLPKI